MNRAPAPRLPAMLHRGALFFAVLAIGVRPLICGPAAGDHVALILLMLDLLAVFFWIFAMLLRGRLDWVATGVELPGLALVVFVLVRTATSCYLLDAIRLGAQWITGLVFFFFLTQVAVAKRGHRDMLQSMLYATVAVAGLYAAVQFFWFLPELRSQVGRQRPDFLVDYGISADLLGVWQARLNTNRAFGTFLTPNLLAGFLVLTLPWLLGFCLEILHAPRRDGLQRWAAGLGGAAALSGMLLSFSKGGWISFSVALCYLGWRYQGRLSPPARRRFWIIAPVCIVLTLAILVMQYASIPSLLTAGDSLHVRVGYWQGALQVIRHGGSWLFGVGTGQYKHFYFRHKAVTAGQTQHAHNDYLELLAEWGLFGFLLFILVCAVLLRRCLKGPVPDVSRAEEKHAWAAGRWFVLLSGAMIFLLRSLLVREFAAFSKTLSWNMLFGVFWGFLAVAFCRQPCHDGWHVRQGWLAGLLGLAVHMFVDFDLYSPGILHTFWVFLALGPCLHGYGQNVRTVFLKAPAQTLVILVLITMTWAVVWWPAIRLRDAAVHRDQYCTMLEDGNLDLAEQSLLLAKSRNPLDADVYAALARFYEILMMAQSGRLESAMQAIDAIPGVDAINRSQLASSLQGLGRHDRRYLDREEDVLLQGLRVLPCSGRFHVLLAEHYRRFAQWESGAMRQAIHHLRQAVQWHPTEPDLYLRLGRYLEEDHAYPAAVVAYGKYLDYGALVWEKHRRISAAQRRIVQTRMERLRAAIGPMP